MLARQATDLQPTSDEWELIRIDMLTEKECAEVLSVVHDLIGYKSRTRLGAASYKGLPLVGKLGLVNRSTSISTIDGR